MELGKTVSVKEIHSSFDNEADEMIKEAAQIVLKEKNSTLELAEKVNLMKMLGFNNAKEIAEFEQVKKTYPQELVLYYKKTYPECKFITEKRFNDICDKYGLLYSESENYSGTIPLKNLLEIKERNQIKKKDMIEFPEKSERFNELDFELSYLKKTTDNIDDKIRVLEESNEMYKSYDIKWNYYYPKIYKLFIAAPPSFFKNLDKLERRGNGLYKKIEIKDPIVFRYVKGGLLIISKWGDESGDIELHNIPGEKYSDEYFDYIADNKLINQS